MRSSKNRRESGEFTTEARRGLGRMSNDDDNGPFDIQAFGFDSSFGFRHWTFDILRHGESSSLWRLEFQDPFLVVVVQLLPGEIW